MECTTTASRRRRHGSSLGLFDAGVELRTERIRSVELSCGQSGDPRICGAGAVWDRAPHTPWAAIGRALRGARERAGGGSCDALGSASTADGKRDLRYPAHGIVNGFVFTADVVLR